MNRAALLFGGQGDEQRAIEAAAVDGSKVFGRLVDRISERLGFDLRRGLELRAPELLRTEFAQPLIVAASLARAIELEAHGFVAGIIAGHSLGEVSAFAAAGCLELEEAMDVACDRGRAMARAARAFPGRMVALSVETPSELDTLLTAGRKWGTLDIAAQNASLQWVLSGEPRAVAEVESLHRTVRLPVDGAWHSGLMEPARVEWLAELRKVSWRAPRQVLITNRTGFPVEPGDDLAELLAGQLTRPINWFSTMRTLEARGVDEIVVAGPSRAIAALCREHLGSRCAIRRADDVLRKGIAVAS